MSTYAEKKWGDCSKAVAYELNFVQLCYTTGSRRWDEDYEIICPYCENTKQKGDFVYPKGSFSKKDYFQLDYYVFGVSENLKNDFLDFGVNEDNFRPIKSAKDNTILGWQIASKKILPPLFEENGRYLEFSCNHCGVQRYELRDDLCSTEAYNGL